MVLHREVKLTDTKSAIGGDIEADGTVTGEAAGSVGALAALAEPLPALVHVCTMTLVSQYIAHRQPTTTSQTRWWMEQCYHHL